MTPNEVLSHAEIVPINADRSAPFTQQPPRKAAADLAEARQPTRGFNVRTLSSTGTNICCVGARMDLGAVPSDLLGLGLGFYEVREDFGQRGFEVFDEPVEAEEAEDRLVCRG